MFFLDTLKNTKKKSKTKRENTITYVAGCGREQVSSVDLEHIAYTALEFDECVGCVHRLEPESTSSKTAADFCVWWPKDKPNPFAQLQQLELTEKE